MNTDLFHQESEHLKVSVLREELVKLTGDSNQAIVLNQFIYWSERTKTASGFVKEEMKRVTQYTANNDHAVLNDLSSDLEQGWIYKTADELVDDTLLTVSKATMTRIINKLIENNWILKRRNPRYTRDNTPQYRVNLLKIQVDLYSIGYSLSGYRLINQFINFADLSKLKESMNNKLVENEEYQTLKVQNDSMSLQNETILIQKDLSKLTSLQNETTLMQNETTLPEITTENEEEDINIPQIKEIGLLSNQEVSQKLIEIIQSDTAGKFLKFIQLVHTAGVEERSILKICMFLKLNPELFDLDLIKQQLKWMVEKERNGSGIGSFSDYFTNGLRRRYDSTNGVTEAEQALSALLNSNKADIPKVSLKNWLKD